LESQLRDKIRQYLAYQFKTLEDTQMDVDVPVQQMGQQSYMALKRQKFD
jgi:hypothetical protein